MTGGDVTDGMGRAWVVGDDIDTDALAPGAYMALPIEELARHCLEAVRPDFASSVAPGDILVGGRNLGMGSSREQAPQALKALGIAAVVAPSFAGIFYRNALNLGLVAVTCADAGRISDGDRLGVDAEAGRIRRENGGILVCEPIPGHLMRMIADGGLVPHLEKRFRAERESRRT